MTDYYAAVRSGDPIAETTVHRDAECAASDADVTPRPISEALVESADPDLCEDCVGNSSDSASGGDDAETCQTVKGDGEVCGRERPCPYHD